MTIKTFFGPKLIFGTVCALNPLFILSRRKDVASSISHFSIFSYLLNRKKKDSKTAWIFPIALTQAALYVGFDQISEHIFQYSKKEPECPEC